MDLHAEMKKTIHRAQHCQRNWDLSREIPKEDMDLFVEAVTQCPSKQNIAFYKAHFITNRDVIEKLHEKTNGAVIKFEPWTSVTNSQVLANLLVVFEEAPFELQSPKDAGRNIEIMDLVQSEGNPSAYTSWVLERDRHVAVGVAAGFLNMVASWLGYSTGCCSCYDADGVQAVLGLEKSPILLMGVGLKDPNQSRRVHHKDKTVVFPTKPKQKIHVNFIS